MFLFLILIEPKSVPLAFTAHHEHGHLLSNINMKDTMPAQVFHTSTSIDGVFAAREIVDGVYCQALTASAQGAKAFNAGVPLRTTRRFEL